MLFSTNPLVLGIYVNAFVNVCIAENILQPNYAAVDDGFGEVSEDLRRLMPRDPSPVLLRPARKASPMLHFNRALLGHRDSDDDDDDDHECGMFSYPIVLVRNVGSRKWLMNLLHLPSSDSGDCSLTTQTCCGDGCMPIGAECCLSSSNDDDYLYYCAQGSRCGIFKGEIKCCGDSACSEESQAAATLISKSSGYTATVITTRPPRVTISASSIVVTPSPVITSASSIVVTSPPTVTVSTPAPVQSVTSDNSITQESITPSRTATSVVPSSATSQLGTTTTATAGAAGSTSSTEGNAGALAAAAATGFANRQVDLSSLVEVKILLLGSMVGLVYAFF